MAEDHDVWVCKRHSLYSKNDLHMDTREIRITPASLMATFRSPGVSGGKTVVFSDASAFLEGQSSSAGIQVLRMLETFTGTCKAQTNVFWNLRIS